MRESAIDCQNAIVHIEFKKALGMDTEASQDDNRETVKTNNTTPGGVEREEEEEFYTAFEEIFGDQRMSDIDGKDIVHLVECAGPGFLTSTPKKDVSRHVNTIWYGPSIHILTDILTFCFPRNLSGMPYDGDLGKKMTEEVNESSSIPKQTSSTCVETIW